MTERHYHLIVKEDTGLSHLLRLDGLNKKAREVLPSVAESQAAGAFIQTLVEAGELERVHTAEGEDIRVHPAKFPTPGGRRD